MRLLKRRHSLITSSTTDLRKSREPFNRESSSNTPLKSAFKKEKKSVFQFKRCHIQRIFDGLNQFVYCWQVYSIVLFIEL